MPETANIPAEVTPLNINPCIFVGIGTTGLKILEEVRHLFYEEFGVAGLPCFRYLVLETNNQARANDSFLPHPPTEGERINLITMTIPNLDAVNRSEELLAWLDERTLRFSQRGYELGTGHRRQGGRLCLWENWPAVRDAITQAVQQVNAPEARTSSDRFLRERYFNRRHPDIPVPEESLVKAVPNVYITGTLCGGTCSGTFLDIGFFFRSLLQVRNRSNLNDISSSEIVGMFTIPDTFYLCKEASLPHVVSCWAALLELDFYTKEETTYELRYPNQPTFSSREPPFTTAYLVSKRHTGKAGFTEDDQDGLERMCAMNLFTEVAAGTAAHKAEIRIDLPAAGQGFFQVNPAGYIRAFSSFGLSAIWYPRYRVVQAICRGLGEHMATDWLGNDGFRPQNVEEAARDECQAVLDWAGGSLLGTVQGAHCPVHLPNLIARLFERCRPEFMAASREGLERYILDFPGGDTTLGQRLSPRGEYYRHVETAVTLLTPELRRRLRDLVVRYLRQHTFAQTRHYLNTLEAWVRAKEASIPSELPVYSQQQNLARAAEVYEDRWTWAVGLRQAAITEFKEEVWNRFQESTRQHLDRLRDHFLKQALANVLGFLASLKLELDTAETTLRTLCRTCISERERLVRCPQASNVVIFSAGAPDSIADDVDLGVAAILRSTSLEQLRAAFLRWEDPNNPHAPREHDPLGVFERRQEALMALIERGYESQAQEQAARFRIDPEAVKAATKHLQTLVHFSSPYFEPSPEWRPAPTPHSHNLLFCCDRDTAHELAKKANEHLQGAYFACKYPPLDHFVFFYQETPGLALSDLAIAPFAAERLEAEEANPNNTEPTRFTHKLGRRMFDPRAQMDLARQWVRDSLDLASELFQVLQDQPYVSYLTTERISHDVYLKDDESIREFIRKNGLDGFIRLLAERLATLDRLELVRRMEQRKQMAQTREEREALAKRHEEIIRTVFPPQA